LYDAIYVEQFDELIMTYIFNHLGKTHQIRQPTCTFATWSLTFGCASCHKRMARWVENLLPLLMTNFAYTRLAFLVYNMHEHGGRITLWMPNGLIIHQLCCTFLITWGRKNIEFVKWQDFEVHFNATGCLVNLTYPNNPPPQRNLPRAFPYHKVRFCK
jgi:hypothetical protein